MKTSLKTTLLAALLLAAGACTVIDPSSSSRSSSSSHSDSAALMTPEQRVARFSEDNLERLKQDIAAGQGEYLASLATLLNVEPAQQAAFGAFAQQHFAALFPSAATDAATMLHTLLGELRQDPRFAQRVALN